MRTRLGVGGVEHPPTSPTMVAFLFMLGYLAGRGVEDGKERNTEGERRTECRKDMILLFSNFSEDAMSTYLTSK